MSSSFTSSVEPSQALHQPTSKPIQILFVGAGAVGCFYASRLHDASKNVHVSLVCRSNYATVAKDGISLQTRTFGNYHFTPSAVYSSIPHAASSAPTDGWDYIVVTTKALPDITDDSLSIAPLVEKAPQSKTCIVLIQNGVGVEEPHRQRFPYNPIVSAVTIISAEQISHGLVRQNKWTRISLGPYVNGRGVEGWSGLPPFQNPPRSHTPEDLLYESGASHVNKLVEMFTNIGKLRDAEAYDEVGLQQVRWHKICINAAMNPSSVLSGGRPNADMVMDAELRIHLKGIMNEVFATVPKVLGREFSSKLATPEQILVSTERNKGGRPSMLVDWEADRPMELEVILGNPVRTARRHGVDMPRMQSLYALLKSAQEQRKIATKTRESRESKL